MNGKDVLSRLEKIVPNDQEMLVIIATKDKIFAHGTEEMKKSERGQLNELFFSLNDCLLDLFNYWKNEK